MLSVEKQRKYTSLNQNVVQHKKLLYFIIINISNLLTDLKAHVGLK